MLADVCWSHSSIDSRMGLAETVAPKIVTLMPDGSMRRTSKVETLTRTMTNYSACVPRNPCYKCGPTGCSTLVSRVFTETKNVPNHFLTHMSTLLHFTPISEVIRSSASLPQNVIVEYSTKDAIFYRYIGNPIQYADFEL